jgi:SAM-dependent methyltransferase
MISRTECPVCGAPASEPVLRVPYSDPALQAYLHRIGFELPAAWFEGRHYALHACAGCGALFQAEVLDAAQAGVLYGRHSQASRLPDETSLLSLAHLATDALLVRRLLPGRRPRVLDFGMGWGRFALLAQSFDCEVDGVEMSDATREHARRHGIRVFSETELPESTYDFILVDQVLEHLDAPLGLMTRLAACLKPGGLLLAGVPGHPALRRRLASAAKAASPVSNLSDRDLDALCPTIHLNLFDAGSLCALGRQAGLDLFHPPFFRVLGAGMLWDLPRQWNRNVLLAWKYSRGKGTRLWFRRP